VKGFAHVLRSFALVTLALLATLARSEVVIEGARYETSAVLRVWLGETPADARLKKGMLGAG
jgi:Chalcone isomerase-like